MNVTALRSNTSLTFRGWQKTSLAEYPGKISTVLFSPGCNFRCSFCYNEELVSKSQNLPLFSTENVIEFLQRRKSLYQSVVISGGEPTLQSSLPCFIERLKHMNFLVGLETNGTNPDMLAQLLERKIVDYIAMDIKTALDFKEYQTITGILSRPLFDGVIESVHLLLNACVEIEFRTTVIPAYHTKEILSEIARSIHGAPTYVLQRFVPGKSILGVIPGESLFTIKALRAIQKELQHHFHYCVLRNC